MTVIWMTIYETGVGTPWTRMGTKTQEEDHLLVNVNILFAHNNKCLPILF